MELLTMKKSKVRACFIGFVSVGIALLVIPGCSLDRGLLDPNSDASINQRESSALARQIKDDDAYRLSQRDTLYFGTSSFVKKICSAVNKFDHSLAQISLSEYDSLEYASKEVSRVIKQNFEAAASTSASVGRIPLPEFDQRLSPNSEIDWAEKKRSNIADEFDKLSKSLELLFHEVDFALPSDRTEDMIHAVVNEMGSQINGVGQPVSRQLSSMPFENEVTRQNVVDSGECG